MKLKSLLPQSRKIPSFDEIWSNLLRTDGFKDQLDFYFNEMEIEVEEATKMIREEQEQKYNEVVGEYESLDGDDCWRVITIENGAKPENFRQLGIYWSVEEHAAEAHWGNANHRYNVKFRARIDLKNVDWGGTIYARMDMSIGESEKEIRFLPKSKIFVYEAKITGRIGQDQPRLIPINKYKLT